MSAAAPNSPHGAALEVAFRHRLGDGANSFSLSVDFTAPQGVTALFGRSGAGKTSIAHAVAGLLRPDEGRVAAAGRVLFDSAADVFLPPERRRVGYVFQEGRLFPHMTIRGNLAFGGRFARRAPSEAEFDRIVALLGIGALLDRRPGALSGGEKQRVAIGRALLSDPAILVMDEPLAALDQARKAEILPFLEKLRDEIGLPMLYVSHSLEEVARLATTIVAVEQGAVQKVAPAGELLADPSVFPLMGRREAGALLEAQVSDQPPEDGLTRLDTPGGPLYVAQTGLTSGQRLRVRVRAQDVLLSTRWPEGISARNILSVHVLEVVEGPGPIAEVALACGADRLLARVTRHALRELALRPGAPCFAVLKSVAVGRRDVLPG